MAVTFCFWLVLIPVSAYQYSDTLHDWYGALSMDPFIIFMIAHMTILHATPLVMTWVNIYYTDIKLLKADWKLMAWHGFFYIFANGLGTFDNERAPYPIITWESLP